MLSFKSGLSRGKPDQSLTCAHYKAISTCHSFFYFTLEEEKQAKLNRAQQLSVCTTGLMPEFG